MSSRPSCSEGRGTAAHFEAISELVERLRASVAPLLGCQPGEVALTRSTTDGINVVLGALELGPGDEVLTSEEEHPGLLAPLAAARARRGFAVRAVPFAALADEVREETALVACSHVSWVSGALAEAPALSAAAGAVGAQVLLDGAQGLGALRFDVRELGCDFYAAAGQKWLCGPDGSGYLYVRADLCRSMIPSWPSFVSLADPARASELDLKEGAARFDLGVTARSQAAAALAALETLAAPGWDAVLARGPALAARLATRLGRAGRPRRRARRLDARGVGVRRRRGRGRAPGGCRVRGSRAARPRAGAGLGRRLVV